MKPYSARLKASLLLALTVSCALFLAGCSPSSSHKTGSLQGSVILNNDSGNPALDPADYGGVTVALYEHAGLNPEIAQLNAEHPSVGVIITQQTEFDHRLQNPVKTAITEADGSFSLNGIKTGSYNAVILKQGWGVRYFCGFQISEGDNALTEGSSRQKILQPRNSVELYPATELEGFVSSALEFKTDHSYLIVDDLTVTADATISPAAYIWANPGAGLEFYGSLSTPGEGDSYARITSADGMYATAALAAGAIQKFYEIDCTNLAGFGQNRLSSLITSYTELGWHIRSDNLDISNLILRDMTLGLQLTDADNVTVSNCNVIRSSETEQGAITATTCDTLASTGLIIVDCPVGISQKTCRNANISNCYFRNCSAIGIYNWYETTGTISHCTFVNAELAINTSGRSNTSIQYCDIQAVNGILNTSQTNWFYSHFTANFNNLDCTEYAVQTTAVFYTPDTIHLDAKNNYWGTSSTAAINDLIWDLSDFGGDPNHPDWPIAAVIDYLPIRGSRIAAAGVE